MFKQFPLLFLLFQLIFFIVCHFIDFCYDFYYFPSCTVFALFFLILLSTAVEVDITELKLFLLPNVDKKILLFCCTSKILGLQTLF